MDLGQRAASVKFLIRDRASQFTGNFDAVFAAEGVRILVSPPQAPRANSFAERFVGTLRREVFDRLLIVNEHHLQRVLTEYLRHYNTARPHRSLGQLTPAQTDSQPPEPINLADHRIRRKQVLWGTYPRVLRRRVTTLRYYRKTQVTARIIFPSPTGSDAPCSQATSATAPSSASASRTAISPWRTRSRREVRHPRNHLNPGGPGGTGRGKTGDVHVPGLHAHLRDLQERTVLDPDAMISMARPSSRLRGAGIVKRGPVIGCAFSSPPGVSLQAWRPAWGSSGRRVSGTSA
jgi:hypothetical protein